MLLEKLTSARGISGQEAEVRKLIKSEIESFVDEVTVDPIGNLIALRRGRKGGTRVMIAAHMDEVGLMVAGFDSDGLIKVEASGGVDPRVLVSKVVYVGPSSRLGVIGSKPVHLMKPEEFEKALGIDALTVDIGANGREDAEKLVKLGDQITIATDFAELGSGYYKGKAFDDRVGCLALIESLKVQRDYDLYAAFTVQEEVGLRGAGVAAYRVKPQMALVLEGTTAHDVPKAPEHSQSCLVGAGPVIVHRDTAWVGDPRIIRRLVETAEAAHIPYQFKRTVTGGTDAGKIGLTEQGTPVAVMSMPCRFIHSPVSVIAQSDLNNYIKLTGLFLDSLDERGLPV
ncbi:MAG: M42 family metallopeptidase [Clostridiales bacterium]|nr:M42 family metallopeptidase [Clostridiales bacterium]